MPTWHLGPLTGRIIIQGNHVWLIGHHADVAMQGLQILLLDAAGQEWVPSPSQSQHDEQSSQVDKSVVSQHLACIVFQLLT